MRKICKYCIIFQIIVVFLQFFAIFPINSAMAKNKTFDAKSMITIEASTGRILYSKDEHKKLPMASTTKIITAIVAIENCKNLDKKYAIPKQAVGIEGSSIYLREGEHLSVRELLYGLMLRSGNDAAVAIAILVGGSLENFVKQMNDYVKNLGLKDTNIVTVNGLHDDNHYTTAYDLAKITASAMKNETFVNITKTKQIKISNEFDKKYNCRVLKNKNKLLKNLIGADGVKTGYTKKAGKCFVGSATRNGMQIISVVLNSKDMFDGTSWLIEKAFKEYSMIKIFDSGKILDIEINDEKVQKVPILIKNDIFIPLKTGELVKTTAKINLTGQLELPLSENEQIGNLEVYVENNLIFSDKIYTINIAKSKGFKDYFKKIINAF